MPIDTGEYSSTKTYSKLDLVHTADSSYVSKVNDNIGHDVTDTNYWQCYADGKQATKAAASATVAATAATEAARTAEKAAEDVITPAEVLVEHVAKLENDVAALMERIDQLGDAQAKSLTMDVLFKICGREFYTEGDGAPSKAGVCIFAEYYDRQAKIFYKYNGSSWIALN